MSLLDSLFGNGGSSAPAAPSPPDQSLLQQYLLAPMGMSQSTSQGVNDALSAIGAGLLTGDRYNWMGPGFQQQLQANEKNADQRRQRAALRMILKQSNPSLTDEQLDAMASDPTTAKLGLSALEAQASAKAGQQAAGILGGLFGGGGGASNLGMGRTSPDAPPGPGAGASLNGGALTPPAGDSAEIQNRFVGALKDGGLTNPFGLGAVAAYAQHESQYAPGNVNRSWSDPSERGAAGTSGGILSWRNERLDKMRAATAGAEDPVVAQAQFTLKENPELTAKLQNAKSAEEANALMADAWQFAGYNRPGGEFARRLATTQSYANRFGQQPTRTADASGSVPPASGFNPGQRVDVAENEQDVQRLESRLNQYPPNVYGITSPAQRPNPVAVAGGNAPSNGTPTSPARSLADADAANKPAPDAQPAEFQIPPGGAPANSNFNDPERYAPGTATRQYLESRAARASNTAASSTPTFPLNDPATATKAIPKLMQVLSIPNLPDAQRTQAKAALDYAMNVVKPTDRARQLMEAGYTPGTPEYVQAYRNLVNADRTPSGYRYGSDGQTLEPIPGGPQDPANRKAKEPPAGFRVTADGASFEFVPGGPADPSTITARAAATAAGKPKEAKPLPQNTIKALNEVGTTVQDTNRFVGTFNDSYAGYGVMGVGGDTLGEIANAAGRNIGGSKYAAQAAWWQDYASHRNVMRNSLFGASLTPGEKAEFEKSDIQPGMSPAQIRTNLQRQADLAKAAAKRAAQPYIVQGTNPDVIESAIGMPLEDLGIRAPASAPQSRSGDGRAGDRASPPVTAASRFGELTASGMTKEQAYARMRQEGY